MLRDYTYDFPTHANMDNLSYIYIAISQEIYTQVDICDKDKDK